MSVLQGTDMSYAQQLPPRVHVQGGPACLLTLRESVPVNTPKNHVGGGLWTRTVRLRNSKLIINRELLV